MYSGQLLGTGVFAPGLKGFDRGRPGDVITLCKLDAECAQLFQYLPRFDTFGDRLDTHGAANLVDSLDHALIDRVFSDIADEMPVDLEVVDRQVFEVGE